MNVKKLCVLWTACVAVVLSLSACTVSGATFNDEPVGPTIPPPQYSYDAWETWTTGQDQASAAKVEKILTARSRLIGNGIDFELPNDEHLKEGWVGVSKFRSGCIVVMFEDEQSVVDGSVAITILPRYDKGTLRVDIPWSAHYDALNEALQYFADWCDGGEPPAPYVMDEEDVADNIELDDSSVST